MHKILHSYVIFQWKILQTSRLKWIILSLNIFLFFLKCDFNDYVLTWLLKLEYCPEHSECPAEWMNKWCLQSCVLLLQWMFLSVLCHAGFCVCRGTAALWILHFRHGLVSSGITNMWQSVFYLLVCSVSFISFKKCSFGQRLKKKSHLLVFSLITSYTYSDEVCLSFSNFYKYEKEVQFGL